MYYIVCKYTHTHTQHTYMTHAHTTHLHAYVNIYNPRGGKPGFVMRAFGLPNMFVQNA